MWFWIWTLIINNVGLIPLGLFIIVILIYIYMIKKLELFWLCSYYIFAIQILITILFFYADSVLIYFLDQVKEPLVVSDPTVFTYNYFYFLIKLSILLSIPLLLLLLFFYTSSLLYVYNYYIYIFLIILFIYYYTLSFWITKNDLFFSNWFSLAYMPQFSMTFDFQPSFEKFFSFFWIEYQEIFLF